MLVRSSKKRVRARMCVGVSTYLDAKVLHELGVHVHGLRLPVTANTSNSGQLGLALQVVQAGAGADAGRGGGCAGAGCWGISHCGAPGELRGVLDAELVLNLHNIFGCIVVMLYSELPLQDKLNTRYGPSSAVPPGTSRTNMSLFAYLPALCRS